MKKSIVIYFVVSFSFYHQESFSQGIWTWMSGTDSINPHGVYGTQGIPSVNNHPSVAVAPYCWIDLQGNFWMYSGHTNEALWKFNPQTLEWTWVKGASDLGFLPPVYGIQGIPSINNSPGSRTEGNTWVDTAGYLWLYGGQIGNLGTGNDLWRYNILTNEWTWMAGSDTLLDTAPIYGTQGVPSLTNNPGSRIRFETQTLPNDNLLLFGGSNTISGGTYRKSDIWKFDISTNCWIWVFGPQGYNTTPNYGTEGVFSSTNKPGGREGVISWLDNNNNFWFFGGIGNYVRADMWEFDFSIHKWAWMSGTQNINSIGINGASCDADSSFFPNCRTLASSFKDSLGDFWILNGLTGPFGNRLGDIWRFNKCKQWTRVSDSDFIDYQPNYGIMGVPAIANNPGGRNSSGHWQDKFGNFWIFGGGIYTGNARGDLWKYTPDYSCGLENCSPIANFICSSTKLCSSSCITFENSSVNGSSYEWFFEGGTPGFSLQEFPANICYDTAGNYDVKLVVHYGPLSDTLLMYDLIEVQAIPIPVIVQSNDTLYCFGISGSVTYQWFLNGVTLTEAINDFYVVSADGDYSVQVTNSDFCSGNDTLSIINIGMNEVEMESMVHVYPNPVDNEIMIISSAHSMIYKIQLFNTLGQVLISELPEKNSININLKFVPSGVYYLTVKTSLNIFSEKLVVVH